MEDLGGHKMSEFRQKMKMFWVTISILRRSPFCQNSLRKNIFKVKSTLNTLNFFVQKTEINGGSLGARKWVISVQNYNVLGCHGHFETTPVFQ